LKLNCELNSSGSNTGWHPYSKSKFGRDAEIAISLYMISKGWGVTMSKGSRGPADLYAKKELNLWCVQVKASTKGPKIKGLAISRLIDHASAENGRAVLAILQPSLKMCTFDESVNCKWPTQERKFELIDSFELAESFCFSFYDLPSWHELVP
jgi:Holliday junction resolvase